ncbi:MAG: proline racemase family protein [Lachnospiraceae bacterium]
MSKAKEVSILNVPTFLYKEDLCTELSRVGEIHFDISFGGSFLHL